MTVKVHYVLLNGHTGNELKCFQKCLNEVFPPIPSMYLQKNYINNKFLVFTLLCITVHQKQDKSNKFILNLA